MIITQALKKDGREIASSRGGKKKDVKLAKHMLNELLERCLVGEDPNGNQMVQPVEI